MRARSLFVFAVALLAAWVVALVPRAAYAQTTTTTGPSVTGIVGVVQRLEPPPDNSSADATGKHPHPNGVLVNTVNFEDCVADLSYEFELTISALNNGYNLNVWAGSQDCSALSARQTSATAVCWPVAQIAAASSNPAIVRVRMRDIVAQAALTTHNVTYSAAPTIQQDPNPAICQAQTVTGAQALQLYFFFADAAGNPVGTDTSYTLSLDTRAGDVQGNISVGLGDTLLIVNVPPTTDTDTQGWNVYCDPPPGEVDAATETVPVDAASNNGVCSVDAAPVASVDSAAEDGASDSSDDSSAVVVDSAVPVTLDDAGGNACGIPLNDAGIPSPGGCSASSILVPGGTSSSVETTDDAGNVIFEDAGDVVSDVEGGTVSSGTEVLIPSKYQCGFGGVSSTQIVVKNIVNGVYYNVAVAAVDAAGNVGPLSNVACGLGGPVNDFFKNYYNDGGHAGGGFCSTEGAGTPAGTGGLGALMVASMVAIVRRRRRK